MENKKEMVVSAIENGTVIDHIPTESVYQVIRILGLEKYKDDGFIWFLESCDLNVFSMRRAMWQMYESGWFKYCRGFIIGRPLQFNEPMFNLDQYDAILYTVSKLDVPVIMDADIGHLSPMMPLICGSMADVTLTGNSLSIQMRLGLSLMPRMPESGLNLIHSGHWSIIQM